MIFLLNGTYDSGITQPLSSLVTIFRTLLPNRSETIESGSLCVTELFQNKSVAFFSSMIIFL